MARINIDDSLYQDDRFLKLMIKLGSVETALGAVVRVWSVAQKWYLEGDRKIPRAEWNKQGLNDKVIEVGLATEEAGRIQVSGADEQFKWLLQRVEAGRRGGQAKASGRQATASDSQPGAKPHSLSPPLSLKNNSFDWRAAAHRVDQMLKNHSNWLKEGAEVREYLGDDLYNLCIWAGTHKMRVLPADKYYIHNLAGMLKEANQHFNPGG